MKIFSLEPEAFGIDFSDLRMRIVKLKKKGKFFDLASWNSVNMPVGVIENGEVKDEEKLTSIIKDIVDKVKGERIRIKYVVASLPERKSFLQVIKVPIMTKDELKIAIPFEAENYIPMSVDQVNLDYELISSNNKKSKTLEVLIGAIPKTIINPYISCIEKAGLVPKVLEVEAQSIARALIKNHVSPHPVIIIDFGKSTTSFIVFSGYSLRFTSSISISSGMLTKDISEMLKVSLDKAEKLKLKYGLEFSGKSAENKEVVRAITPSAEKLVNQTKKYIDYYHTHVNYAIASGKIKKIILCGSGSNLKGLQEFMFSQLKIPVELANPWVNILPGSRKKIPKISFKESLGYVTALGVALRGIEE